MTIKELFNDYVQDLQTYIMFRIKQMASDLKPQLDKINRTLQPYARISKVTLLDQPLEMTTTKKVKRTYSN